MTRQTVILRFASLMILATAAWGCAVNPATGRSQLMLVSESQEIAMGQQADPGISAMFGIYDDAGLQQYVKRLGDSLAATSERPNLPWTFRVVDDSIPRRSWFRYSATRSAT
jgi:predicted Zn-dependent protease